MECKIVVIGFENGEYEIGIENTENLTYVHILGSGILASFQTIENMADSIHMVTKFPIVYRMEMTKIEDVDRDTFYEGV